MTDVARKAADAGPQVTDVALAIDFGGTKTAVGCATASGELLLAHRMPTYPSSSERTAPAVIGRVVAAAGRLRQQANAEPGWRLVGAGAVTPGVAQPDRVLLAPNLPGWESLPLARVLSDGLPGLTVTTGNDVRAAALAEARWGRLRGVRNGLYVNVGTGLGAAVVLDGRPVPGAHGAAGEIGYAATCGPGEPQRWGPGGRRTLEDVIGGGVLGALASEVAGRPMTAADAFAATEPRLRRLVDEAVAEFGRHLASFATLLDPERIVIGGGLMNAAERLLGPLRAALAEITPFPPELLPGALAGDAGLLGAAALALDRAGTR